MTKSKRYPRERYSRDRRIRIILVFAFLQLCFALLAYRTFSLQCLRGDELRHKAEAQYEEGIRIEPKRGDIYDRNLQPLAVNVSTPSLYADPSVVAVVEQQEPMSQSLSSILELPRTDILRKLDSQKRFIWLKRKLPDSIASKIESLKFSGLGFREEEKRFYPKGALAAHVIGFVGLDNTGLDGIERACDSYMQGKLQEREIMKDRIGRKLTPQQIESDTFTKGYDVILTIDEVIQHIAEVELRQACQKSRAESGSVIVMDPRTGEILALANYPTYDLNEASTVSDEYKRNRAIRDLYEPGSAFKIVTAASVINEGLVGLNEKINCENGAYRLNGYTIHDIHRYESLTFSEVIEYSSNIGTVKVASRLGDRRLYSYIEAFGFTGKTGVDMSERAGFVRPPEDWTKRSMSAIPFGQEIAITPLQMLCSMNAIANDGVMMKPFIVQSVRNGQETLVEFSPQKSRTPISSQTARTVRQILVRAVENGTGKNASIYGYKVAGKTGTAQKASKQGGYMPDKYVSSFVGSLSGKGLAMSMIVVINEPQGEEHTGGAVACPVFKEIATQVTQYLTIGQRRSVTKINRLRDG